MHQSDIMMRFKKVKSRAGHFRALVAAYYVAPSFAARVPWRAVGALQSWGLLEPGAIKLTAAGHRFVELAIEEQWFMHGWSEARTELARSSGSSDRGGLALHQLAVAQASEEK